MSVWRNDDYENINEYVNKRYFKQAHFKGGGKSTGKTILTLGLAAVGFWNPQLFGVGLAGSVSWASAIMGASLGNSIWAATHKQNIPSYSQSYNFDVLQNSIDSKAQIPIIYGRRKWGGYQTWHNTSTDKQSLTKDIVLCEGEIDGIEDVRANDLSFDNNIKIYRQYDGGFISAWEFGVNTSNWKDGDTYEKDGYTWTRESYVENGYTRWRAYRYESQCPGCTAEYHFGGSTQSPPDNYSTVGGYKNVAWIRANLKVSEQLTGSNPTITCIVRGRKVYDPRTGQTVYSTNPALCARDYLLNKRFGTGRWISESMLNEDAIIECANYCDEIISWYVPGTLASYDAVQSQIDYWNNYLNVHTDLSSDTRDNIQDNINSLTKSLTTVQTNPVSQILVTGKRYECNIVLADQQSHIDNLEQIMATFGGFLVFNGEQISLRMEKETGVSYAFNDSNICANNGAPDIKWSASALSDSPNQYNVTFYDPDNNWTGVTFEHNDPADQKLRGRIIPKDVTLSGITSMSQAIRLARIFMAKNRLCPLKCTFSTATHAMNLEPGDIITITHGELEGWQGRILSITESNGKYTLTCQQYNASIYDDKTGNIIVKTYCKIASPFNDTIPDVTNLTLKETTYTLAGTLITTVKISWDYLKYTFFHDYQLDYSIDGGKTWNGITSTITNSYIWSPPSANNYMVRVRVVNTVNRISSGTVATISVSGKDDPPPDVTAVLVETLADGTRRFSWDYTYPDPNDIAGFRIKYNAGRNLDWSTGTSVTADLIKASPWESQAFKGGVYTVMIKAVDNGGNESHDITYAVLGVGDQIIDNVLWSYDMSTFKGKKIRGVKCDGTAQEAYMYSSDISYMYSSDKSYMYKKYTLSNQVLKGFGISTNMYHDNDSTLKYSDKTAWFYKGEYASMEYDDSFAPDSSGLLSFDYDADGPIEIYYRRKFPYSMYVGYDNEYAYSDDDTLMYKEGPWVRYYGKVETVPDVHEIKVKIEGGHIQPVIRSLKAIVDVPDVVDTINDFSVPEEGAYIPLTKTFTCIKNVSVTIQDVAASNAVSVRITGKSTLKPYITLYGTDSFYTSYAGKCSGLVDITIQGY